MFSFESYNSTCVQFVTDWFKKVRLLNDFAAHDDHLPLIFVRGILMHAVSSCEFLSKVVKELTPSGQKASDIAMLRQISIQKSILTDHRDHLARQGKTLCNNMAAFDADQYPDYAIFVAQCDASGGLPERIFSQFDRAAKLPHASQKLIVSSLTEPAPTGVPLASLLAHGRSPDSR